MKRSGIQSADPMLENIQVDWLLVPAQRCRTATEEERLIARHFRRPGSVRQDAHI